MKFIQVAIADEEMVKIRNGMLLMQYLRGHGLNPLGDIFREKREGVTIYTERIQDEKPRSDEEIPALA
jgi:hypothetical protein